MDSIIIFQSTISWIGIEPISQGISLSSIIFFEYGYSWGSENMHLTDTPLGACSHFPHEIVLPNCALSIKASAQIVLKIKTIR